MALSKALTDALAQLNAQKSAPDGVEESKHDKRSRQEENTERAAVQTLALEAFTIADRIATALEERAKPSIALAGAGTVIGELAKFEPLLSPELVERAVVALEAIAGQAHA